MNPFWFGAVKIFFFVLTQCQNNGIVNALTQCQNKDGEMNFF